MLQESPLTRKEYWDNLYDLENRIFDEAGLDGDEWFDGEVRKIVLWLTDRAEKWTNKPKELISILDVGTGNGRMVFRLAEAGFGRLTGTDYSEAAVALARKVRDQRKLDLPRSEGIVTFVYDDIASAELSKPSGSEDHEVSEFCKQLTGDGFDIVHDKGTLDVFIMREEAEVCMGAYLTKFLKPGTILVVTSANSTHEELVDLVTRPLHSEKRLEVLEQFSGSKKFTFGGKVGAPVATVAFVCKTVPKLDTGP